MITISELLEDPKYKEFFLRVPKLPAVTQLGTPPWRVWVLTHHKEWRKRDFATYPEAFNFFKKMMKRGKIVDGAINCRRYPFEPPMRMARIKGKYVIGSDGVKRQATTRVPWKVRLPSDEVEDHLWCPYCRRPTVFKYFTRHHALSAKKLGMNIDPSVKRCIICGISERLL